MLKIKISLEKHYTLLPYLRLDAYQRSLSWDEKLQAAFIISVVNDWPTGIIVLNKIDTKGTSGGGSQLLTTHDIIDGQQRLSTLKDFLENPLIYVYKWQSKEPDEDEPLSIQEMRDEFEELVKKLRKSKSGSIYSGKLKSEVRTKVFEEARIDFRRKLFGDPINNIDFKNLIDKMNDLYVLVSQRLLAIQETEASPSDAEKMYTAINTHGEPVEWWELLRAGDFNKIEYKSEVSYSVRYTSEIIRLSKLYLAQSKFKSKNYFNPNPNPTLWDAMFALGEYYHAYFAGVDPKNPTQMNNLINRKDRKLKVDGLGFRLISGLLSHEVSRVSINHLFEDYELTTILRAIDSLFNTAEILFSETRSDKFKLFQKYSKFGAEVIPAYPQICLIIAAAQIQLINNQTTLSSTDQENLRILAEEILRESICTERWSGTADKKLKEWLDNHFFSTSKEINLNQNAPVSPSSKPFPGGMKSIQLNPNFAAEWQKKLSSITSIKIRTVPKEWQYFHFLIQYLWDSKINGTLPKGPTSYDHIVAYNPNIPLTTHPYNFCALYKDLNNKKSRMSYIDWNPFGSDKSNYEMQCINNPCIPSGISKDFLKHADIINIQTMINEREQLIEFALVNILNDWIRSGD